MLILQPVDPTNVQILYLQFRDYLQSLRSLF